MLLRRSHQAKNDAPPIKPYKEALDFQRKRTPMLRGDFYSRAMDTARPRAFTITGLQKYSSLLEAHRLGETAIAENMTMSDYADRLGEIVDEHGGTILSPERLELIHHNTMVNNNAAGAWNQMTDPDTVEDRPYFQYQGPNDNKQSKICRPIHGLIVRYTDPILRHMWQPNHHWERHEWVSLAKDQVDPEDVYVSPEGQDYPVVNGQVVRPADGWDFHPADVFGADDTAFLQGVEALGAPLEYKSAADYGLAALDEIDVETLSPIPTLEKPRAFGEATVERQLLKERLGFLPGAARHLILDYANDGLYINDASIDHLLALDARPGTRRDKQQDRFRHADSLLATLANPLEVWYGVYEGGLTKRYIGAFRDEVEGKLRRVVVFFERSAEGWLMKSGRIGDRRIEKQFRNSLLVRSGAPRKEGN